MLCTNPSVFLAAALLLTPSLASPIAISFGNPTFNTITFGRPFSIQWYGGDGTPATIVLNGGHVLKLQAVGSVGTGLLSSPHTWTPIASSAVKPGVPYVLSIVQSGLTNYSPTFYIAKAPAGHAIRAPLSIGTAGYYPLQKPMEQDDAAIFPRNDATGGLFPRQDATGGIFPRKNATGDIFRRHAATGVVLPRHDATGVMAPQHYATGFISPLPEATPETSSPTTPAAPFATGTYYPTYATGSGTGSGTGGFPASATGGIYSNVTASNTAGRLAAAYELQASASNVDEFCEQVHSAGYRIGGCPSSAGVVSADTRTILIVVFAGCALLMFWF
ncbi:MAG: hypothetical protein Q9168_007209 [Polycauliona sp. 1 TL-2023]